MKEMIRFIILGMPKNKPGSLTPTWTQAHPESVDNGAYKIIWNANFTLFKLSNMVRKCYINVRSGRTFFH